MLQQPAGGALQRLGHAAQRQQPRQQQQHARHRAGQGQAQQLDENLPQQLKGQKRGEGVEHGAGRDLGGFDVARSSPMAQDSCTHLGDWPIARRARPQYPGAHAAPGMAESRWNGSGAA
ncbi:hypothetical protein ALISP_7144 [Alicycliphilus sp. B1]|nr:hypothetical protein ALISP_0276 [Alicycliphilus sp. B1]GAO27324.1 hypothetical protein ALISP_7144 [Alicycliphilus sp. B1]